MVRIVRNEKRSGGIRMANLYVKTQKIRFLFLMTLTVSLVALVPGCSDSSVDAGLDRDWETFSTEHFSIFYPVGWDAGEYIEWLRFENLGSINSDYYDFSSREAHKYFGFFHAENYLSELSEKEKEALLKGFRDKSVEYAKDDDSFVSERDLTISGQNAYKYMVTTESVWAENYTSIIVSHHQNDLYYFIIEANVSGYQEVKQIFDHMLNSMEFK